MQRIPRSSLALVLLVPVLAFVAGCGKGNSSLAPIGGNNGSADMVQVNQELAAHPEVLDDGGLSTDASQATVTSGGGAGASPASIDSAITPLFFFRRIDHVDRSFEFAFADTDSTGRPTRAIVTVFRTLTGTFNILAGDTMSLGGAHRVSKPLVDHWVRRIELRRIRVTADGMPVWRIVAASAVKVTARNASEAIASVRVQSGGLDTTLTDPLQLFRLRSVLKVTPDAPITLTVTTNHVDDILLLHAADRRFRFHNDGGGAYSGTWTTPDWPGLRHVGIDAITHATLYDSAAPYDSQQWMLPYVVVGTDLGDFLSP